MYIYIYTHCSEQDFHDDDDDDDDDPMGHQISKCRELDPVAGAAQSLQGCGSAMAGQAEDQSQTANVLLSPGSIGRRTAERKATRNPG